GAYGGDAEPDRRSEANALERTRCETEETAMPNLFEDDVTGRLDLSSEETAMYLYDVDPGESFPYHYEYVEEWLLVVDGTVAVRTPDGDGELHRGDLVRYAA